MTKHRLCKLAELDATGAKGISLAVSGGARELFVARKDDRVYAYENRCPHKGGPLEWIPDRFLDDDGELIVCATHAAMFRIHDGRCVAGPCAGARLSTVEIVVDNDSVFLNEQ